MEPELSNYEISAGLFITPRKLHFKIHKGGVITFIQKNDITRYLSPDLVKLFPATMHGWGWGNGYIAIPYTHPIFNEFKQKSHLTYPRFLRRRRLYIPFEWANAHFPLPRNTWTFSGIIYRFPEVSGQYYMFGFDTMHGFHKPGEWPEEKVLEAIESIPKMVESFVFLNF